MAIANVIVAGKWTRQYKGLNFSYLHNSKSSLKVSIPVRSKGVFTHKRFHTIKEAVAFIDSALENGATIGTDGRNELII